MYLPRSDLKTYLRFGNLNISHDKNNINKNAFDIDLNFCNIVNDLSMVSDFDIMKYIQLIGINGFIYHPKQITNIFANIHFYTFLDNIFILHKSEIYIAKDFIQKFLYDVTFETLSNKLIKSRYYNLNKDVPLLILVFPI